MNLSGGAGLFAATAGSKVGPLSSTEGGPQVGEGSSPDGTLAVDGGVTLASTSYLRFFIDHAGTTPGTDYSQLTATGTVNLAGAQLSLGEGEEFVEGKSKCAVLKPGDVDTLLTTSGSLSGTFAGVPDGTTIPLSFCPGGGGGTLPTVKINYTEHTVTATVETPGAEGNSTTTTLSSSPEGSVTNQEVTLTATVSATSGAPSGSVTFQNHGMPIPGCENRPLSLAAPYTASCRTSFAAVSSPESLTASFSPNFGSELERSISSAVNLTVAPDTTLTGLAVSNATPTVGTSVTYTATVTPAHAGPIEAEGHVQFQDNGVPIEGCTSQSLTAGKVSSSATCSTNAGAAGKHQITVTYAGDADFSGSIAPTQEVNVQPEHKEEERKEKHEEHKEEQEPKQEVKGARSGSEPLVVGRTVGASVSSGTVTIRAKGTSTFVSLSGSKTIPDESEVEATNGRVLVTAATPTGKTVTAEVYGGRFRVHQTSSGETQFILTLPLTGCPRVALPRGAAALAKHSSGPKSRHLWVSEGGGSWGTNGRFVSTSVEGTTWLTLDECTKSEVKVTAGKVQVRDLVRRRTRTVSAGHSYVAVAKRGRHA